jgi:hypothetical protein
MQGTVIDFHGGTAYYTDGSSAVTDNSLTYYDVDYYVEGGFKLDFIGDTGIIGNYYGPDETGANNAVIHGHWATGDYGGLTKIEVTKTDGTAFDLNYFILTSNTDAGGTAASGSEQTYINSSNGSSQLLPSDDWGWVGPDPQIFLNDAFGNGITSFDFTVGNTVDCFGMDEFYIDEDAPPPVPDAGGTLALVSLSIVTLAGIRRRLS